MPKLEKWKLRVSKRNLLFVAAFVWGFAAQRVFGIGLKDVLSNTDSPWPYIALGFFVAIFFFYFIFLRVFLRYTERIYNLEIEKPCIFSFFNWQGYGIMAFMITLGVVARQINILPAYLMGAFYVTIGVSLFVSSLCFLYSGIRYEYFREKYVKQKEPLTEII